MRELIEEAELADQLGLDVFAVGEHHRPDYLVSSPATVLAAIAARTERIRLSSAVTVLSSDDPVRVFQQFAHVDLISGGRAEIMAGRGSFIESFPLFGYDLDDYDELYAEKLDLLLAIRDSERVTWSGKHRAPLERRDRVAAPGPEPAARVGRGRRHAAVGGPRRRARAAADDRDHRRRSRSASSRSSTCTAVRSRRAGHAPDIARLAINTHAFVDRTEAAGQRRLRRPVPGDDEPDRPRARLAAGRPRPVRRAAVAARRAGRRLARAGDREAPLRARAVRPSSATSPR